MSIIRTSPEINKTSSSIRDSVAYLDFIIQYDIIALLSVFYGKKFVIHGYYRRKVYIPELDELVEFKIMRIRDVESKKTHAILLDFMVPYHQLSSCQLIDVMNNKQDPDKYDPISSSNPLVRLIREKNITDYDVACDHLCRGHYILPGFPVVYYLPESGRIKDHLYFISI